MPFDANLVLVDGSAAMDGAVSMISTTRDSDGFVVIDLKKSGAKGLCAVVVCPSTVASGSLRLKIDESDNLEEIAGGSTTCFREVCTLTDQIVTGDAIDYTSCPGVFIHRFTIRARYIRCRCTAEPLSSFGLVQVLLTPYPFEIL